MKTIIFAGGCFWGVEKFFSLIKGVSATEASYVNGHKSDVNYHELKNGDTGFVEAVKVIYDDSIISLEELLELYYQIIDPTSLNKQGNDIGTQYGTGVYYENSEDLEIINKSLERLQNSYNKPIVVELELLANYVKAEEYHQKYLDKNPHGYCHIGNNEFNLAKNKNN